MIKQTFPVSNPTKFLAEFEAQLKRAQNNLGSNDTEVLLKDAINLCAGLSFDYDIEDYKGLHSKCFAYLGQLNEVLMNRKRFSEADLGKCFSRSLQAALVVQRIYVALAIACSFSDYANLDTVISMLTAVSHPLRGVFLRYTAVSFVPTEWPKFMEFSFLNFSEMLDMMDSFKNAYPQHISLGCDLLGSSLIRGLVLYKNDLIYVKRFITMVSECSEERFAVRVLEEIVKRVDADQIQQMCPLISDWVSKAKSVNESRDMVRVCCKRCTSPICIFNFVQSLPFVNDTGLDVLDLALKKEDKQVIKLCLQRWKTVEVHAKAIAGLGMDAYAELIDDPVGIEISNLCIDLMPEDIRPESLRKIISNDLVTHSNDFEEKLCKMIHRFIPTPRFIQVIFAEPFVFLTPELILSVYAICERIHVSGDFMLNCLSRSTSTDERNTVIAVNSWNRENGDSLIDHFRRLNDDNFGRIYLITQLHKFRVSEEKLALLIDSCRNAEELERACWLCHIKQKDLFDSAIRKLAECDGGLTKIEDRLKLYLSIVNMAIILCDEKDEFGAGILATLLDNVCGLLNISNKGFAVAKRSLIVGARKIFERAKQTKGLHYLEENFQNVINCLAAM